jgi:hypothetical protein
MWAVTLHIPFSTYSTYYLHLAMCIIFLFRFLKTNIYVIYHFISVYSWYLREVYQFHTSRVVFDPVPHSWYSQFFWTLNSLRLLCALSFRPWSHLQRTAFRKHHLHLLTKTNLHFPSGMTLSPTVSRLLVWCSQLSSNEAPPNLTYWRQV